MIKIRAFINGWNDRCHPFIWTKPADQILNKIKRKKNSLTLHEDGPSRLVGLGHHDWRTRGLERVRSRRPSPHGSPAAIKPSKYAPAMGKKLHVD